MTQRFRAGAFAAVTPHLLPGELPRVATRATVEAFGASRFGSMLSRAIVPGIADAVTDVIRGSTGAQVVVATDRRVLFLSRTFWGGAGDELLSIVPRELLSLAAAKFGTVSILRIAFAGGGVSLTFPRVDQGGARALAAELGS